MRQRRNSKSGAEILPLERSIDGLRISRPGHPSFWACFKVGAYHANHSCWNTDTVVGWITVFARMVACAGPPAIIANMITSLAIFNYENYKPKATLLMWALIIVPFVFNLRFRKL